MSRSKQFAAIVILISAFMIICMTVTATKGLSQLPFFFGLAGFTLLGTISIGVFFSKEDETFTLEDLKRVQKEKEDEILTNLGIIPKTFYLGDDESSLFEDLTNPDQEQKEE